MPNPAFDPISARQDILAAIAKAAVAVGRDPAYVSLTAVSKQQPWEAVEQILAAGQRVFGENRVQEAAQRWAALRDTPGLAGLELRLIGPLQTNKAREALNLFDVIETVDRPRIAKALADAVQAKGVSPRFLVQVNTGEESQKGGVAPAEADAFIELCRGECGLAIEGLMCIPPADEPPGPHFALLAKIAARQGLTKLSMGMSADFAAAVRFGATSVRVGSALFGRRLGKDHGASQYPLALGSA